jgi:hypothetical protein
MGNRGAIFFPSICIFRLAHDADFFARLQVEIEDVKIEEVAAGNFEKCCMYGFQQFASTNIIDACRLMHRAWKIKITILSSIMTRNKSNPEKWHVLHY